MPSLQEVFDDPSLLLSLPPAVVADYRERFRNVSSSIGLGAPVPPDPIVLALQYPRWGWLDCRHIRFLGRAAASAITNLQPTIFNTPPRHTKSTTISVWTPFWALARDPETSIIFISYEQNFARRWGVRVRQLVETYGREFGLHLNPDKTAGADWELTTGGGMFSVGVGGGIPGRPAKLLIVDDAIKDDAEARSLVVRDNTWDWWESTVISRIESDTAVIIIGTRWHEDDLIGRLLQQSAAGVGIPFDLVTLPAVAEKDDILGRDEGEGLWLDNHSGKFPQEWYEKRKREVSSYTWNCVYQQHPSPPGGMKVDPAWWRFYLPSQLPSEIHDGAQSWDLSLDATKKTDSYHCGGVGFRSGALVYFRDGYHEHSSITDVMSTIRAWNLIYPQAKTKLIERSIAGPALIDTMRFEVSGLTPWPPKGRRKGSKEACLDACVPDIRSGNVLLPLNTNGTRPKWVDELVEEMRAFPKAPHDDYVDMVSQLLNYMLPSVRASIGADHSAALRETPRRTPEEHHVASIHQMIKRLSAPKLEAMRAAMRREERAPFPQGRISTGLSTGMGVGRGGGRSRRGRGQY